MRRGTLANARARLTHLETGRSTTRQKILTEQVDLTDFGATRAVMESVVGRYGSPDWLIVTAGFSYPGYLSDLEMPALEEMMDVNYFGTVHAAKALLTACDAAKPGAATLSIRPLWRDTLGLPGYAGYCGSKFAVIGFSWALRHELRPYGIAVFSAMPSQHAEHPALEREKPDQAKGHSRNGRTFENGVTRRGGSCDAAGVATPAFFDSPHTGCAGRQLGDALVTDSSG